MYFPFEFWLTAFRTSQKLAATMTAASIVVDRRMQTMTEAAQNPLRGDYAELSRMVPEKVEAFSKAGASMIADIAALQAQAWANWSAMAALAAGGRGGNLADWIAIANRSSRMIERASEANGKALAPVHRAVTGNARRLKRR